MSGHDEQRAAELRREYLKRWREKNPDKVKRYNREYWLRKAQKSLHGGDDDAENETDREILPETAAD